MKYQIMRKFLFKIKNKNNKIIFLYIKKVNYLSQGIFVQVSKDYSNILPAIYFKK
jgi:hypothetical protein